MVMTCSLVDINISEGDTSFIFGVKVSKVVKWQVVYKIWERKLVLTVLTSRSRNRCDVMAMVLKYKRESYSVTSKLAEVVTFMAYTWEVIGLYLSGALTVMTYVLCSFLQSLQTCQDSSSKWNMTVLFHILSNNYLPNHFTIQYFLGWSTNSTAN